MGFYEQISRYYDYIFPVAGQHLNFIKEAVGGPPKKILDVACGSGGYSVQLAKEGHEIWASDIDVKMVDMAREKARKEEVDIIIEQCDMKRLESTFAQKFEGIFCIGNSLVHLASLDEIEGALKQMHALLEKEGVLVLQIINYDKIINFNLNELPTVKNDDIGLEFVRKYQYNKEKGLVNFNTILSIENSHTKEKYTNSIELLPLLSGDMMSLLEKAGFSKIQFYGDFNYSPYTENSFMLVVKALK